MSLLDYLAQSRATDAFRSALEQFARTGQPNERVEYDVYCPPVKVERTLIKMLESFPELPIERVAINARSGCEFFRGTATIEAGGRTIRVRFEWNCRWKAEQMGWSDWFGLPDQMRAAREFGHDCFSAWDEQHSGETAGV